MVVDFGRRERDQQQRHADPVVEAALDVEALPDPRRKPRLGHDGLPERSIRGREQDGEHDRLGGDQMREHNSSKNRAENDGERQTDGQQPQRNRVLVSQQSKLDPRGVSEQHHRQSRFGDRP